MHVRRSFEPSVTAVGEARRFVAAALAEAGLPGGVVDVAQLAVSELATNAVEHAGTSFEVALDVNSSVRVAVHDGSTTAPRLATARSLLEGGRGLVLVDAVSDDWGYDEQADGKWVWCELRRTWRSEP